MHKKFCYNFAWISAKLRLNGHFQRALSDFSTTTAMETFPAANFSPFSQLKEHFCAILMRVVEERKTILWWQSKWKQICILFIYLLSLEGKISDISQLVVLTHCQRWCTRKVNPIMMRFKWDFFAICVESDGDVKKQSEKLKKIF